MDSKSKIGQGTGGRGGAKAGRSGPAPDVGTDPLVYGVWLSRHLDWLKYANGDIVSSDYIGLIRAQCTSHMRSGGTDAKVMIIGDDGEPAEIE